MLKYRSSSSSSLPRNATDIEQTFSGERKFATSSRLDLSLHKILQSIYYVIYYEMREGLLLLMLLPLLHRSSESGRNLSESEMDHKKTLQELNSRLVAYVEKVRKLQRTTDAIDSMPKMGVELSHVSFIPLQLCKSYIYSEHSVSVIKKKFEAELSDWKKKLDESQNVIAQLKIDLGNSNQDNKQLQVKYDDNPSVPH